MQTYQTLDGDVLDLSALTEIERAHLERCYQAFRENAGWWAFTELVTGRENPLLGSGQLVTRRVYEHPLFRAIRDLESRLGIRQGKLAPEAGDDVDADPFADEFVTVAEAARRQGVTAKAVYKAIERGELVAVGDQPLQVSLNSLRRWSIDEGRQEAGRMARAGA